MKNSTLLGSAASVLLVFSMISYSRTDIQQQGKTAQPPVQSSNPQTNSMAESETASGPKDPSASAALTTDTSKIAGDSATSANEAIAKVAVAPVTYTATAYSLRGRTASGRPVARGLIAADPRFLPLGTRVRIDAGEFSGEYVVADTGGAVKGRRVDIWTPTAREAMRFGRRAIKLTVLEFGGRKGNSNTATRPRMVHILPGPPVTAAPAKSQN